MLDYVFHGCMGGHAMYVFQTNQIEATMNNQSNCCSQQYLLMSSKFVSARWQRKQCPFALFHPGL